MSPWIGLERTLLHVSGPDARGFLQNLLTQNLDRLDQERVVYSALLSPQGKVITDMFVWAGQPKGSVFLDVDPQRAPDLVRRLNMYKLRADVTISDFGDKLGVVASQELGAKADPRFPKGRLGERDLFEMETWPDADPETYETYKRWRLTVGIPDLAVDAAPEEVFALEALLEELNGVDFQKGCFIGQENVSRMKRRATTRKKFCPVVFEGEAPPYGATVSAGAAELGSVRSGMPGRAIALLRLDRALEATQKGGQLLANGIPVRLDPPDWLILPERDA